MGRNEGMGKTWVLFFFCSTQIFLDKHGMGSMIRGMHDTQTIIKIIYNQTQRDFLRLGSRANRWAGFLWPDEKETP
jgi:hypothetical protein